MKKFLLLTAISSVFAVTNANATEYKPYVAARVAYMSLDNDAEQNVSDRGYNSTIVNKTLNDETIGGRFAVGFKVPLCGGLAKSVRTEIEYGYNNYTSNSGSYSHNIGGFSILTGYKIESKIQTVMWNSYYDLDTGTKFTPYIGVGIGYANIKEKAGVANQYDSQSAKDSEDNFAWNISTGVSYEISSNMDAELGYRYTDYGSVKNSENRGYYSSNAKRDYDSHEIMLGLRYNF